MASINQMGGVPAINNIPQGYTPYYNAQTFYNVPNYSPVPNNGYIQRSPYENYLNGKGSPIEQQEMLQNQFFKCRPVSSKEQARAFQIDLDGSLWVFTDIGNQKIYTKQINADGTASFNTYVLTIEKEENPYSNPSEFVTKEEFNKVIQALLASMPNGQNQANNGEEILNFN